jgi:hypothetical protein
MDDIIKLPNVDRDERIGSAFNHLFQVIQHTDNNNVDNLFWDFSNASFFHPFFLAPLVIYKQSCKKSIMCTNKPFRIVGYLDLVHFDEPLAIKEKDDFKSILESYISKTYVPVCQFDLCKSNIDDLQTILQRIIKSQSKADSRITTPLSYLLGELIDNINEHSYGKHGYIFSQYLKKENCIDLVIADDGITIFGSYIKSGKYLDEINDNEAEALKLANEGKSTKNLPDAENRGYGISSSKKMLVDGLHGSFFMLSGGAFHRYDSNGAEFVKLPDTINWNGTVILMRIPVNVPSDFDYKKYTR